MKVSVVIPAHDAEETVAASIASVLAQTEPAWEAIVVDDASADRTREIVAAMAARDGRVRLIRSFQNRGPGGARNLALDAARGEWIAWLDADDTFLPERLARLLAIGGDLHADMVSDNILLCPADGSQPPVAMLPPGSPPAAGLMDAATFVLGNVGKSRTDRVSYGFMQPMIRRDFLERNALRFDGHNRFGEDYMLYLHCLVQGARWWYTPEPMYRYTVRAGSLTDRQSAEDLDRIRQMERSLLLNDPMVAADAALARAVRLHKAKIERDYYYRAFTDAVKARAAGEALRLLLGSPGGFRHIVQESCYQAPTILGKALHGGYRARHATRRAA